MDLKEKYTINSNYIIKNDVNRIFITYRYSPVFDSPKYNDADTHFFSFIHPDQAKILALFDGERDLSTVIEDVAKKINTSKERAEMLVKPLIQNNKRLGFNYKGNKSSFPQNIIVPYRKDIPAQKYSFDQFNCSTVDLKQLRLYNFPLDVTLMVNTVCCVDCIYCYADCRKKMDCQIPQERIEKLISDCRRNDVRSIDLMGGEVLMYQNWRWLLKTLIDYGYNPYVSTKIPVRKEIIEQIFELGIRKFQISLDSFSGEILEKNLNISNGNKYIEKMGNTLKNIENIGIDLNIHAVITKHNKDTAHLQNYLECLSKFGNIKNVQISIVGESLYKPGYRDHKLSRDEIDQIKCFIDSNAKQYPFSISFSAGMPKKNYCGTKKEKSEAFDKRGLCSANVRQVFILPDGNVTGCEELMFNPRFIMGNIVADDLKTIWDNNKLNCLFDKELHSDSKCGKCNKFDKCKNFESAGVCWKEILHAYGENHWNYPDPKCPHAPKEMNKFFIE